MTNKQSSSQAAWALLMEGVTRARVDTHRLRHMINRALSLVESSEEKEHLYQVAGDIIVGIPDRFDQLEIDLDRTSLALSKMGSEFLESRLPLSEKTMVDEAVESAFGRPNLKDSDKLAKRFVLRASKVTNAPGMLQEVLNKLEDSGARFRKIADFYQWEFPGDYSYITYRPKNPYRLGVSGKKSSKSYRWFAQYIRFFDMEIMNGGSDGPTEWQFKLK